MGSIAGGIAAHGMNISFCLSYSQKIDGVSRGVVNLVVEGTAGDVGEIENMQIATILRFTDGVTNFTPLSKENITNLAVLKRSNL